MEPSEVRPGRTIYVRATRTANAYVATVIGPGPEPSLLYVRHSIKGGTYLVSLEDCSIELKIRRRRKKKAA